MTKDNKATGRRLKECITLRNMQNTELCRKVKRKYGIEISRQNISNYFTGTPISEDKIKMFSEALNIYNGYLLGDDNFLCGSYAEYIEYKELMDDPAFNKFDKLLSYADIHISSQKDIVNDGILYSAAYTKGKNRNWKSFTSEDAENFIELVSEKIRELFDSYISYDDPPLGNSIEAWTDFLYWHPSFLDREENQYYLSKEEIAEIKKNTGASDRTE